ncbi:microviridin/marinostatin family tricyclic proteinase inhibitor [Paraburkholderia panacisoli]|jgi:hypothetical protein|uniref:Microviridin/marinostatin family tricyclic proteinase inhibitor n=1 Tax=Paraburkholderia panacisoli TaxID=2603818 RepID=A0A5B0G6G6_9BURK|nr:microviridin/marinostatin family tricyclic proteinase inhibitor [Paraburkholderia panacisoli]KAA0997630.1 microviridin/marinostatin family tricyclic proteinase inhibitor [Paraburkholderia panacisoli]
MSDVKIKDLPPVPFFAHFLEGQFSRDLTGEEMKALRGGSAVTMAAPSDQEGVPIGELPDIQGLLRSGLAPIRTNLLAPHPVTMAYPSDGEVAPAPFQSP